MTEADVRKAFLANPYPLYRRLRTSAPVRRVGQLGDVPLFLVTGYPEARAALTDERLCKSPTRLPTGLDGAGVADPTIDLGTHMLNSDPPEHGRLRRPVVGVFTAHRIRALRPRIADIAADLVATIAPRGHADLLADFGYPLAVTVICELLGIPPADRDRFREWSEAALTPVHAHADASVRTAGIARLRDYLCGRMADLRASGPDPNGGLLAALVSQPADLSEDEVIATVILLLLAGHDSSMNLIGNGMLALLTHPAERDRLVARPELIPGAVEEMLRYDGPGETAARIAAEPVTIAGVDIPPGSIVNVSLGGANRDERVFEDAERFDVTRRSGAHLGFGHGVHRCVGAPLAMLEGEIAITTLLRDLPDMRLAMDVSELSWRQSMFRGLVALPVEFTRPRS